MEMKKKRWLWIIPALAFAFAGPLHADDEESGNDSADVSTCSSYEYCECSSANYCFGNPCDGTWSFQADWLFWRPCNEGLILGLDDGLRFRDEPLPPTEANNGGHHTEFPSMGTLVKVSQKGKAVRPDSGGTSGFRFGLGYQPECSTWDMMLKWTYFDPKSVANIGSKHRKEFPVITPFSGLGLTNVDIFTIPTIVESGLEFNYLPFKVSGSHRLILDFVDLEFGRRIDLCDCLSLRPHVDLRYFTLDQHYSVKTKGPIFARIGTKIICPSEASMNGSCPSGFAKTREKFEYRFQGLGPRIGVNGEWYLGCGFGLYADAAASLILGDRRIKNTGETFSIVEVPVDVGVVASPEDWEDKIITVAKAERKSTKTCTKPIFELGIGLTYQRCLCDGKYATTFKFGWEHLNLANHSIADSEAMIHPLLKSGVTSRDNSDLTIQGLTFSAMFQF